MSTHSYIHYSPPKKIYLQSTKLHKSTGPPPHPPKKDKINKQISKFYLPKKQMSQTIKIILIKASDFIMITFYFLNDEKYLCFIIFASWIRWNIFVTMQKNMSSSLLPPSGQKVVSQLCTLRTQWQQSVTARGKLAGTSKPSPRGPNLVYAPPGLSSSALKRQTLTK